MNILKVSLLVAVFTSHFVHAKTLSPSDYKFEIKDGNKATIAGSSLKVIEPTVNRHLKLRMLTKADRPKPFFNPALDITYYPVENPANRELFFILSGLGGDKPTYSIFLADLLQKNGFASVILPNNLSAVFTEKVSRSSLPGDLNADTVDLYRVMKSAVDEISKSGQSFDKISFIGYSMGALMAPHIIDYNNQQKLFKIEKTLLINPPVDLLYGLEQLDSYKKIFNRMSLIQQLDLLAKAKHLFKCFQTAQTECDQVNLSNERAQAAIGAGLSSFLTDTLLESQKTNDFGYLPEIPNSTSALQFYQNIARRTEARNVSLKEYFDIFMRHRFALDGKPYSINTLNQESSLYSKNALLQQDKSISVMHNANDFLLRPEDLTWLNSTFTNRIIVYPAGGHLANLSYTDNVETIKNWLLTGTLD